MQRIFVAIFLAALPAFVPAALAQTALETVQSFYVEPYLDFSDPATERQLTGAARATFQRNAQTPEGEGGCIDFSPVVDGQDYDAEEITQTIEFAELADGVVSAIFTNFGELRTIVWTLELEDGVWKVADIANEEAGWTLGELCR